MKKKKKKKAKSKTAKSLPTKSNPPVKFFGIQEVFSLVDNLKFDDAEGEGPSVKTELQIFPSTEVAGEVYHPSQEGPLKLDNDFFEQCVQSFEESGIDIMVDYNHASGMALSESDGAAAGFITELRYDDNGLWGTVEWNERGLKSITAKEYKYLSPEWATHQYDKGTGEVKEQGKLYALGLTNRPYLEGLLEAVATASENNNEGLIMTNDENLILAEEPVEGEAAEEQTETTADAVTEPAETAAEETTDAAATEATILASQAKAEAALAALREVQAEQRNSLIMSAQDAGKITPAMLAGVQKYSDTLGALDTADGGLGELKEFLGNLPIQTFSAEVGEPGDQSQETDELSETDRVMASRLGISVEQMKKFGNARTINSDGKLVLNDGTIRDL